MEASTIAPMAIAIPPRDMMFEVSPIIFIGMNERMMAIGIVKTGITALGKCQRKMKMIIVAIIIFIFLWHFQSAVIPVFTIPIAIILSFIPMKMMGLTSNIMSLGGIAIAIGAMVDASIVVVEQTHKKLEI